MTKVLILTFLLMLASAMVGLALMCLSRLRGLRRVSRVSSSERPW